MRDRLQETVSAEKIDARLSFFAGPIAAGVRAPPRERR